MEPDERGGDVWPERAVALYCAMLVFVLLIVGLLLTDGRQGAANAAPTGSDPKADAAWRARLGAAMGALPTHEVGGVAAPAWDDTSRLAIFGADRLNGDRLEISSLSFNQFPAGFPSLAAYLADEGCGDLRIGLVSAAP